MTIAKPSAALRPRSMLGTHLRFKATCPRKVPIRNYRINTIVLLYPLSSFRYAIDGFDRERTSSEVGQ